MAKKMRKSSNNRKQQKPSRRERDIESLDMRKDSRVPSEERLNCDMHSAKPNDWRWYAQNPQLIKDYASYPFGNPLGNPIGVDNPGLSNASFPGIMALEFIPAIGWSENENSPINVAAKRLYSFVRHANSGASNYDTPDLMLYMICVDSALMYHSFLKRLYGIIMNATPFNRYYPQALFQAMHVNYDSLVENLSNFRGFINQFAVKLSQLWIPNSMSYMARHSWMCEGLYVDSMTEKAQTYIYTPVKFYQFQFDTNGAGMAGTAQFPPTGTSLMTYENLVSFGNSLINPMLANEDFGIMSGDILKAFGESGIVKYAMITEDYRILPVYSEEVMSQIENSVILGANADITTQITQTTDVGTGYLVSKPVANISTTIAKAFLAGHPVITDVYNAYVSAYSGKKVLNFHHSSPTPEEVMVASRLTVMGTPTQTGFLQSGSYGVMQFNIDTCGSEIVISAKMYSYLYSQAGANLLITPIKTLNEFTTYSGNDVFSLNAITAALTVVGQVSQFDWHPTLYQFAAYFGAEASADSLMNPQAMIVDADYYTVIDKQNMDNMNATALLSEFAIPQF